MKFRSHYRWRKPIDWFEFFFHKIRTMRKVRENQVKMSRRMNTMQFKLSTLVFRIFEAFLMIEFDNDGSLLRTSCQQTIFAFFHHLISIYLKIKLDRVHHSRCSSDPFSQNERRSNHVDDALFEKEVESRCCSVCVCVYEREREREMKRNAFKQVTI